jgi:hypothetical protein
MEQIRPSMTETDVLPKFLQSTSFKTRAEDLLELWYVVKVHQRVVLPWDIGICGLARPWLQLVVQPVRLASLKRNRVENINYR